MQLVGIQIYNENPSSERRQTDTTELVVAFRIFFFAFALTKRILVSTVNSELRQTRRCNPWTCEVQIVKKLPSRRIEQGI